MAVRTLHRAMATSLVALAGLAPALPAAAAGLDRTRVPGPAAMRPFRFPDWQEAKLANGMPVILVEDHKSPVVSTMLILRGGADTDPVGKAGRAALATELWTKGTPNRTASQIDETVESFGASLAAGAARSEATLSLKVPSEHFATLLPLFADVALHPTVPTTEFQQEKDLAITGLKQSADKVGDLASRAMAHTMFPNHPYGEPASGSVESVGKLTQADLQAFFRDTLAPANGMLVVAGDIQPAKLLAQLNTTFGKAKPGKAVKLTIPMTKPLAKTNVVVVDKPGAVQSAMRVATWGLTTKDKDEAAWTVANAILGGLFTSRLNANLREEKGYTYGAGSRFTSWQLPGYIMASANVETKFTVPAVQETLKELNRLRTEAVPAAELNKAKAYLIGTYPNEYGSAAGVASAVAFLKLQGLSPDFIRHYRERVAQVTSADVQRVAKRFLDPGHLAVIVAGDAKATKGLEAYGPVTVIPVREKLAESK